MAVKPATKGEILDQLVAKTGLKRKEVSAVLDELSAMIGKNMAAKNGGAFALTGLVKFKVVKKPATAGGMKPNPFKPGEMMKVKPKPARKVVKAVPLKALKALV